MGAAMLFLHGCSAKAGSTKIFLLRYIVSTDREMQVGASDLQRRNTMTHKAGLFRNMFDAMVAARSKQAERQIAQFLNANGRDYK
ncbi:hypothetical protein ATL17_0786 [Maritalea mobilis]|uniref:Uncharacterized protein n=1 Tax=Maritalea mobilis TaxID=483324 RepID=A0A4R6VRX8_9HYPH|nr:hypothetical protein ATL17_0786 [Maritalea mobilis]